MPRGIAVKSEGKMVLAWRAIEAGEERNLVANRYNVAPRTIGTWCTLVRGDSRLLEIAKSERKVVPNTYELRSTNGMKKKGKKKATKPVKLALETEVAKHKNYTGDLEDEVMFLRWWNEGERKGYVDRLLKKIQG